jgi:septum formation protein
MLILASTSITRRQLLDNAGVQYQAIPPEVDEAEFVAAFPHLPPAEMALRLAQAKALAVSHKFPETIVIGADQVLCFDNRIYSKPKDKSAARKQLSELRGHTHQLISATACASENRIIWSGSDAASLTMRNFSSEFLESYLTRNGENSQKSVGGYQIEGLGIQLFERVTGDHFTILGLPLLPLLEFLRNQGVLQQ